jgi:Na+/proline symporter
MFSSIQKIKLQRKRKRMRMIFVPIGGMHGGNHLNVQMPKQMVKWGILSFLLLFVTFFIISIISMEKYDCNQAAQEMPKEEKELCKATYGLSIAVIIFIGIASLITMGYYVKQKTTKASVSASVSIKKTKASSKMFQGFLLFLTLLTFACYAITIACPAIFALIFSTMALENDDNVQKQQYSEAEEKKMPICNEKTNEVNLKIATIVMGSIIILFLLFGVVGAFRKSKK